MTCADDLNPYATSGEEADVLVLGVKGTLSLANTGGAKIGTMVSNVYGTYKGETEYAVLYKSATATPTTDVMTITDSGTRSSLRIPVKIISPGDDAGSSFFALATTSGAVCPGEQVFFDTKTQGDAKIVLSASNGNDIIIGQGGTGDFVLGIQEESASVVTATAGSSTVMYPANIPSTGFTAAC